jgi:hypothetical protein
VSRAHLYILAGVLTALALGFAAMKVWLWGFPLHPHTESEMWRVEVQLTFVGTGGPAKLALNVPTASEHASIANQRFAARGYGITRDRGEENDTAIYATREARGQQYLYYRVMFDTSQRGAAPAEPPPTSRAPSFRADELLAAKSVVDQARAASADARTLAAAIMSRLRQAAPGSEAAYLVGRSASPGRLAHVATDLLLLAGTPARVVNGLSLLPERRNAQFVRWVEVYDGERWFAVHPHELSREERRLYMPWWRGRVPLAELEGGTDLDHDVDVSRSFEPAVRAAVERRRAMEGPLVDFSLFGLPLQTQALFRTLLAVPLGVLVLVVLRNVVGFKTFGTFMPVLIALAFRQTGLAAGVVFFCIVLAIGLAVRFYLERLKLLLVPRLASLLIVVVLAIAVLTVLSHRLGFDVGLSIGLFPIVILTMTIERMTVTWEERGPGEALQQALGSLAVAVLCYFLVRVEQVQHVFFVYPEMLLLLLAATLLLGRYTGYRLLDLFRFRVIAEK